MTAEPEQGAYDAITLAVAHNEFKELANQGIHAWGKESAAIYDLKHILPVEMVDARL